MNRTLTMILLVIVNIYYSNADWKYSGNPYGGGYQRTQCFTSNGSALYAGTLGMGVWISNDNGNTYKEVNEGLTNKNVSVLIYSNSTLIAGTDDGIFISTNNGTNWLPFNTGLNTKSIFCAYQYGTSVLLGTMTGLYIFLPNQMKWQLMSQELENVPVGSILFFKNNLYISTFTKGLMKSTNVGQSWTTIYQPSQGSQVDYITAAGNTLFLSSFKAGSETDLYSSDDEGVTWNATNNGLPVSYGKCFLTLGNALLVGNYSFGNYISIDGGKTWNTINEGFGGSKTVKSLFSFNNNIYCAMWDGVNWVRNSNEIITEITEENPLSLEIVPNPVSSVLNLKSSINLENVNIDLIGVRGEILSGFFNGKINSGNIISSTIDYLTPGAYFLRITSKEKNYNLRFIKN